VATFSKSDNFYAHSHQTLILITLPPSICPKRQNTHRCDLSREKHICEVSSIIYLSTITLFACILCHQAANFLPLAKWRRLHD